MVYHNPESLLENETHKLQWDFEIQTNHLISARRSNLIIINKKERTCWIVNFAVPGYHRIKLNNAKIRISISTLLGIEKLWNMKVTIIQIIIGASGTVTEGLVQGLEELQITGRVETFQTTAL